MIKFNPIFIFDGQCAEALDLYIKAFDAEIIIKMLYSDANPKDFIPLKNQLNFIYHVQIKIGEQIIVMGDDSDGILNGKTLGNASRIGMLMNMETDEKLKTAYEVLSVDAIEAKPISSTTYFSSSASVTDKFGVRWDLMAGFVGNENL